MAPFRDRHFEPEVILWAVRWYCKQGISYRELKEMLSERGVKVEPTRIYRWVQRHAPENRKATEVVLVSPFRSLPVADR